MALKDLENILTPGKKYTVVVTNDMGFVSVMQLTLEGLETGSYAQYNDAIQLIYRQPRQRKNRDQWYHSNKNIAIYEGFVESSFDQFGKKAKSNQFTNVTQSHYLSCDPRNFTDTIGNIKETPIFKHTRGW